MQMLPNIRAKPHKKRSKCLSDMSSQPRSLPNSPIFTNAFLPDIRNERSTIWLIGGDEKSHSKSCSSETLHKVDSWKEGLSSTPTLPRIGKKKRTRSVNSSDEEIHKLDKHNRQYVLKDRIKEFMTKEIPGKPPSSLRYSPPKGQETKLIIKPKIPSLPINTNSCPNLYLLENREQWIYNYKPGKCRYLRCPQSPVLQPEEIFPQD